MHDYVLLGYSVDGEQKTITFKLVSPTGATATAHFKGVEGYHFEHDLGRNILYGIAEAPLANFLTAHAAWFEEEQKWGWPLFWQGSVESTLADCEERTLRLFESRPPTASAAGC